MENKGPQVRRVVTGHDDDGRAVILIDGIAPNTFASPTIPGFGAAVAWMSGSPADHISDFDPVGPGSPIPGFPGVGETIIRIAEFPPDKAYPADAQEKIFDEIVLYIVCSFHLIFLFACVLCSFLYANL